jgi:hypothetical protein
LPSTTGGLKAAIDTNSTVDDTIQGTFFWAVEKILERLTIMVCSTGADYEIAG